MDFLGTAWATMLEVSSLVDHEREACERTFAKVIWESPFLNKAQRSCVSCGSGLVAQIDAENIDFQCCDSVCNSCGVRMSAVQVVEHALDTLFFAEAYIAMTQGGVMPLEMCEECGHHTYIIDDDYVGCVWCKDEYLECSICNNGLTKCRESVIYNGELICNNCDAMLSVDPNYK